MKVSFEALFMLSVTNHQRNAIKTTMRYHLTPVRMAVISKSTTTRAGEDVGKGPLVHCWGERRLGQPLGEAVWRFLTTIKMGLPMTQQSHFWEYICRNPKH